MKSSFFIGISIFFAIFWVANVNAAAISADDFLPPVAAADAEAQKATTTIQQPDAVKEEQGLGEKPAIAAATAQDAVNAAIERIAVGGGCEEVKFPSGFGFVASGTSTYSVVPNPTANLLAQRQAYQIALLNAKKNMASYLNEMPTQGKEQLQQNFKNIISDTDTLSNTSETLTESIAEMVQAVLRGYVVYNIADEQDGDVGQVRVAIVATPKTMGKGSRIDPNSLTATNVREGLNSVLQELSTGLLSPVGGKVISVPQTGELAFVGFGSAVVPDNPDKAVQAKLMVNAQKMAQMRARSALCGIILGDKIDASASMDAATATMSKQFDEVQKEDPSGKDETAIVKLAEQRKAFSSTQMNNEQISSLRKGVLPRGVNVRTFMNPEKTIAEAVAVYLPSATARAGEAARDMQNAKIVQDQPAGTSSDSPKAGQMPKPGPTGQIMKDADL